MSSGPVDFEDVEIATAAPFAGADDGGFAKYVAHGLRILGDGGPYYIANATILGNRDAGRNRDDTHAAHHRGPTETVG